MKLIKPFCAVRPREDLAELVAALPYDVLSVEEAAAVAKGNPYSFLHVDKPEIDCQTDQDKYQQAKKAYQALRTQGILIKEEAERLYLYRLQKGSQSQLGLAACVSLEAYQKGIVKKHELTVEEKEWDRKMHVERCNAQTGPIFLTYRGNELINSKMDLLSKNTTLYDFTCDDHVRHTIWAVEDPEEICFFVEQFEQIPSFYIADGHHRNAAAAWVREKHKQPGVVQESDYCLSVLFPMEQLQILGYHRMLKDSNGWTESQLIAQLQSCFEQIQQVEESQWMPTRVGEFGAFLGEHYYRLTYRQQSQDPVSALDVSILQQKVLNPIFGIEDPRTNPRIAFVGGSHASSIMKDALSSGQMAIAFALYPTPMESLFTVADANEIMPPKSTWFEPKLRSGLLIHELS